MSTPKKVSKEFKNLPAKHKAIVALRALKDTHGFDNHVIAKALDYHPDYVSSKAQKLKAIDFVDSSDVIDAFKTIKSFSKGESVNEIKPKDKTVLTAASKLIEMGTDHNDHVSEGTNLTLNLNILRGIEPDKIADKSLDDRLIIDVNETVVVEDIAKDKKATCDISDLLELSEPVEDTKAGDSEGIQEKRLDFLY